MTIPRPSADREPERYVFLVDLAEYLNRTSQWMHVKVRRLGIVPVFVRREASGRGALAVTADEARRVIDAEIMVVETISPESLMKDELK